MKTTPIVQDTLDNVAALLLIGLLTIPFLLMGIPIIIALDLTIFVLLEVFLGFGGILSVFILVIGAGSALGAIYFIFWLMESLGLINENLVDFFIHNIL